MCRYLCLIYTNSCCLVRVSGVWRSVGRFFLWWSIKTADDGELHSRQVSIQMERVQLVYSVYSFHTSFTKYYHMLQQSHSYVCSINGFSSQLRAISNQWWRRCVMWLSLPCMSSLFYSVGGCVLVFKLLWGRHLDSLYELRLTEWNSCLSSALCPHTSAWEDEAMLRHRVSSVEGIAMGDRKSVG